MPYESVTARILANCIPEPNSGCWLWTAATDRAGYGVTGYAKGGSHTHRAHRVSYEAFIGLIPEGMLVCHKCDTPGCVNPDHLFVGTPLDNMLDKARKGRVKCHHRGKTHCVNGHLLSGENVSTKRGRRDCVVCARARAKAHYYRRMLKDHVRPRAPEDLEQLVRESEI